MNRIPWDCKDLRASGYLFCTSNAVSLIRSDGSLQHGAQCDENFLVTENLRELLSVGLVRNPIRICPRL